MNAFVEKMKDAGVDTVGARLTTTCIEAIRRHPDNIVDAWRYVGATFGHEFVRSLIADMQPKGQTIETKFHRAPASLLSPRNNTISSPSPAPYKPRVISPERLEKRRELRQIVRSKYQNSGGIAWSDVGWHELSALKRDGVEAQALLDACQAAVPNDGRTVGDVLGIKMVDEIIGKARAAK